MIRKEQQRYQKIKKLREKFAKATSEAERRRILQKILKLNPLYPVEEVLGVKVDRRELLGSS